MPIGADRRHPSPTVLGRYGAFRHGGWRAFGLRLIDALTLETYDQDNFGFLRFEVTKDQIVGKYFSAPFEEERTPQTQQKDTFTIDLANRTVT